MRLPSPTEVGGGDVNSDSLHLHFLDRQRAAWTRNVVALCEKIVHCRCHRRDQLGTEIDGEEDKARLPKVLKEGGFVTNQISPTVWSVQG